MCEIKYNDSFQLFSDWEDYNKNNKPISMTKYLQVVLNYSEEEAEEIYNIVCQHF